MSGLKNETNVVKTKVREFQISPGMEAFINALLEEAVQEDLEKLNSESSHGKKILQ